MRHNNTHEPITIFKRNQRSRASFVAGAEFELLEELGVLERYGEGEPVAFWNPGIEVCGVAEVGGVWVYSGVGK